MTSVFKTPNDAAKEKRGRRALNKAGYGLRKSHDPVSIDNLGGYMIVDLRGNYVVAGSRFDMELSDVERWLAD